LEKRAAFAASNAPTHKKTALQERVGRSSKPATKPDSTGCASGCLT